MLLAFDAPNAGTCGSGPPEHQPPNLCSNAPATPHNISATHRADAGESPQTEQFVRTFGLRPDFRRQYGGAPAAAAASAMPAAPASGGMFAPMPMDEEIDLGDD